MGLLIRAIELVSNGKPLQAASLVEGERLMVLSAAAEGGYTLTGEDDLTRSRHFKRPASAVRTFYRMVGAAGLARAVSGHYYRALFPCGSSLEWPPKPL
jgi:hypothetical protein